LEPLTLLSVRFRTRQKQWLMRLLVWLQVPPKQWLMPVHQRMRRSLL